MCVARVARQRRATACEPGAKGVGAPRVRDCDRAYRVVSFSPQYLRLIIFYLPIDLPILPCNFGRVFLFFSGRWYVSSFRSIYCTHALQLQGKLAWNYS